MVKVNGREFLFFDSIGNFTRTTWWNENYVLDRGILIDQTVETQSSKYQIEIIDSFNIKISRKKYAGYFYGNPWKQDEDFTRSLNRFIVGDSMKKLLVGNWVYELHEMKLAEHLNFYNKIPDFVENKLGRIGELKIENQPNLEITKSNEFIVTDSLGNIKSYRYIIDDDEISLRVSDYIISLGYEIDENGNLILINKPRVGEVRIQMRRK